MIPNEPELPDSLRLQALRRYQVLDTGPEQALDDLTKLAAQICGTPIALISLVDESRQWFKAKVGLEVSETPRAISFCGRAIRQFGLFLVPDATRDPRFADSPLVTGPDHIQFYAGAPLVDPEAHAIGTLCVMDHVPRTMTEGQQEALRVLARQVMTHLELNFHVRELRDNQERLLQVLADRKTADAATLRLAAIVEFSDDAIIGKDLYSVITSWNRGAEKVFGYTAEEMVGTSIMRLIPPDRQAEEELILGKIRAGESVEHFETVRRTKSGALIEVSVTASPIKDAAGNPIGVSKVARNITEQKRSQLRLRLLETCINRLNDIVLVTEADPLDEPGPRILFANRAFEAITGYEVEEAIGRTPRFLQGPNTDRKTLSEIREAIRNRRPIRRQIINYAKDGSEYWLDIDMIPVFDQSDLCTCFVAIERDITAAKQAEAAQKLASAKITEQAALLDKARDAILVRELDGKITYWNASAERIYGWTRGEAVGRNVGELLYTSEEKFAEINRTTLTQGDWHGEVRHLTKERKELTIEARWTLIRNEAGQPTAILAINTDITERKKLEAQFLRAQRMESIGTLAGGIAHDLNNILAPIMMSIDVLKLSANDSSHRSILETIEISAKRGADIVRQVLSFARGLDSALMKVQTRTLLRDLESIIKDTFPKDIRLQFSSDQAGWSLMGDPTQLHQVLLNLAVNARDAMPHGGTLSIAAENVVLDAQYAAMNLKAKPGRYVRLSVTDTGTGIHPEIIDKIFDPFFTTKDVNKGTGLGLSTVMAIVKSHSGVINVYSEPERGTTFKIYVPAYADNGHDVTAGEDELNQPRGHGETILVVDDEASILTITRQTLEAFGYQVLTASDGAQAVAVYAVNKAKIAVVVTDMMMPIMDGAATIRALKRVKPEVKVIAASGLNANGPMAHSADPSIKHFLVKPYTAATLLTAVHSILTGK